MQRPKAGPAGVDSKLLALLRRLGWNEKLAASTESWFNKQEVLVFLADRLSEANFVDPATQALYDQYLIDGDAEVNVPGADPEQRCQGEASSWLSGKTKEDLQAGIQVPSQPAQACAFMAATRWSGPGPGRSAHARPPARPPMQATDASIAALEAQIAQLKAISDRTDEQLSAQRAKQSRHASLAAARSQGVETAHSAVAEADAQLNALLQSLRAVVQDMLQLLSNQAGQWLLSAADLTPFYDACQAIMLQAGRWVRCCRRPHGAAHRRGGGR
jgi:hypothetical protein